jgi:general secretion pathway protein G
VPEHRVDEEKSICDEARQDARRGVEFPGEKRKDVRKMPKRANSRGGYRRSVRAFTLLEVMIVIVIILAILGLVTVNLMGTRETATKKTVQIQLGALKQALEQFQLEFNRYPTEDEGLAVLWSKESLAEEEQAKWRMFTKEPLPRDAWGTEWGYQVLTSDEMEEEGAAAGFKIWSNGPDKEEGTSDDIYPPGRSASDEDDGGPVGPPSPDGP